MSTLNFKSNIKCAACVEKVKPVLDTNTSISKWDVDLKDPERTLSIEAENLDIENLKTELEKVGYKIEKK
ncbi:MAG TPA: heavy-metal-associated domain-containing protein [Chitinophagaceae bacterium]|nr:heavy-metal-associated domain-containing protein [Chitinophagaceae bacterium]